MVVRYTLYTFSKWLSAYPGVLITLQDVIAGEALGNPNNPNNPNNPWSIDLIILRVSVTGISIWIFIYLFV